MLLPRSLQLGFCGPIFLLGVTNPAFSQNCNETSVGKTPLNDLGSGTYQSQQGGLYPGGINSRPSVHQAAGLAEAAQVVPRDTSGNVDLMNGKIVLLSIGMSNTKQEWQQFQDDARNDNTINRKLEIFNGAEGGWPAELIKNPNAEYWTRIDSNLSRENLSPEQVQAVWFKEAHRDTFGSFPEQAQRLRDDFREIMNILRSRFPNLRVLYASSRIYGGYGNGIKPWVSECWAYETGFAVKWLIEDQINGDTNLNYDPNQGTVNSPWISWGPYTWADGLIPRSDGLIWECSDFEGDGIHPGPDAEVKVSNMLMDFFKNDSTTASWFLEGGNTGPVLSQSDLNLGQTATFTVTNMNGGEIAYYLYSLSGTGSGPCVPQLGGLCLDLLNPVVQFGTASAAGNGTAILSVTIPSTAPLTTVSTQAVVQRGVGGADSVKSNTVTAMILP